MKKQKDDRQFLDPVFLKYGMQVYSNEFAQTIREDVIDRKTKGKRLVNLIPQEGFQERVATQDADLLIVGGKKGGGKALSVDTQIVTPYGYKRMGDLVVGDVVSDPVTGGATTVEAIYEHPNKDLYKLIFEDGESVECCEEHLWKLRCTADPSGFKVWPFAKIKRWLDEQKEGKHIVKGTPKSRGHKLYLSIPCTVPVEFEQTEEFPIDPYVIGALLGDGCITHDTHVDATARFVAHEEDVETAERFVRAGIDMSHTYRGKHSPVLEYHIRSKALDDELTSVGLYGTNSNTKFIPDKYKFASVENRIALLQGLMDTDGWVGVSGKPGFCSVSKRLAEDVKWVIESLGGVVSLYEEKSKYRKDGKVIECGNKYSLYIKIKDSHRLFNLTRKRIKCKPYNGGRATECRRIVGYEYVGKKDARCISVSSPHSLYMANTFVVTHNTWIALFMAMRNMFNPDLSLFCFRKYEDDVKRGPWKEAKKTYRGFGTAKESSFEFSFLDGRGATMKMEHIADLGKIADRFRGAELAYIDLEELPEHTRENLDIIFDFLAVNRNTCGVKSQMVATCNPVGWKNKLRKFLEYYIDPETDTVIPERDGQKRYMFKYGSDDSEIAWGNTWQEVYAHPKAKMKIDLLIMGKRDLSPKDMILTVQFIEGDYADNKILQITDKRYVSRLASKGDGSVINDLSGVWRDIDEGSGLLTGEEMRRFFDNTEQRTDGIRRASCDVAIVGDFFVIYAAEGRHIIDMEAWFGEMSDAVIPFIEEFLRKNGVNKKNFTFDANGLGVWLSQSSAFKNSHPFNNKSSASDPKLWNNLKSESAEKWVKEVKMNMWSIDQRLLEKKFTDKKGHQFNLKTRLDEERMALKRKDDTGARFEIIDKKQMKLEVGHSPDFIEGLIMFMPLFEVHASPIRRGFSIW